MRGRFIAGFTAQCDSVARLLTGASTDRTRQDGGRRVVHRMTGLAGTIGFPSVSRRAADLEALLAADRTLDEALAQDLLSAIREAYVADLMHPPDWASVEREADGGTVMIVEDDPDQLALLELQLHRAGYRTVGVPRGDAALATARERRPSLVLLDVDLPGMDGYSVCRALKTDGDVGAVPVIFLTTHASIDSRVSGLALGADDYLCKPVDVRELLLRMSRLRRGASPAPSPPTAPPGALLAYDVLAAAADAVLAVEPAAIALVRVTASTQRAALAAVLSDELRRRDAIGDYDAAHLLCLMPGLEAAAAVSCMSSALARARASGVMEARAGIAAGAAGSTLAALVAEADDALAEARYRGELASAKRGRPVEQPQPVLSRTVLLADDDPEVMRIADGYLRAAGFMTVLAFDGARALQAIAERQPDVVVLDLMMPSLNGFDVLMRLKDQPRRPRIVVLSARGREEDVTRAFDLGADDYVVKPFSPQELRARILRLLT